MAPATRAKPRSNRAARDHIRDVALKAVRAQAHGWPVTVTVRGRPERKVRGRIVRREAIEGFKLTGADGESNLQIVIEGETIPLERVVDIRRQRLAPEAG